MINSNKYVFKIDGDWIQIKINTASFILSGSYNLGIAVEWFTNKVPSTPDHRQAGVGDYIN